MSIFTKGDKILIALILVLNLFPLFFFMSEAEDPKNKQIVVTVDGNVISRFPLRNENEMKKVDFHFDFEGKEYYGVLETRNGRVRLLRLPEEITPKSIHADMGWISKENQMIVALPVKLVITVEGEEDSEIDIISY